MSSGRYLESDSIDLHFPSEIASCKELEDVDIIKRRVPKRVLYFSDGTLEEFSSEEEQEEEKALLKKENLTVDPNTFTWGPWLWYQTIEASVKLLAICDYLGESLAHFFGILSPKYDYEIEHYKRLMAEEESLKRQQDIEMAGWASPQDKHIVVDSEYKFRANNRSAVEERF